MTTHSDNPAENVIFVAEAKLMRHHISVANPGMLPREFEEMICVAPGIYTRCHTFA